MSRPVRYTWVHVLQLWASQVVLVVKNPPVNAGDGGNAGSIPGSGTSPRRGHGNPLQYSCLENPMDRGPWRATVHEVAESHRWLKWLSTHALLLQRIQYFFFNWGIVAFQYCFSFCCTVKWINDKYTYIPSLLDLPLAHPHPTPLVHQRARRWAPCAMQHLPTS